MDFHNSTFSDDENVRLHEKFFNCKVMRSKILKHAVLFKSATDGETESHSYLNTHDFGMAVSIIHVMDFEFLNQDLLLKAAQNPCEYSGIILTSQRAVKAIENLFKNSEDRLKCLSEWKKKLNYSVGKETGSFAETCLGIQTMGQQSGNSENLVRIILNDFQRSSCLPFLFPCSQMRKNTLIQGLNNGGVFVEEIVCYAPVPRSFSTDWLQLHTLIKEIGTLQGTGKAEPDILVFFSPSGVKMVHSELSSQNFNLAHYRVIALGASTCKELSSFGINAHVCDEPSPQGVERLLKILNNFLMILFSALAWYNMKRLSETNWRTEGLTRGSWIDCWTKQLMARGCDIHGFRLMCQSPDGKSGLFPAGKACLLDLLIGSLAYSFLFVIGLWITSPLPDVTTNFFLIVSFTPRPQAPLAEGALIPVQAPLLQMMRQGGGEGLIPPHLDEPDL